MENNETKKTNNSKKYLIVFIIVLAIVLAVAIPVSLLSGNKPTKSKAGLKEAKEVKDYECTKKGNVCSFNEMYEGVEVNVEVAKGKTYTFSMIANDKDTMTLMLQQNIKEKTDWHGETINMKGPQASLQRLNEAVATWDNISYIEKYSYEDKGKKDLEAYCKSDKIEPGFKCPADEYDTRGYKGITIDKGDITFLFNLPQEKDLEEGQVIATEGTILAKVRARLITIEEVEEFNIDKGMPSWLIEGLDANKGYWTMTSSPSMTTAYYQGALAVVNNDKNISIESVFVQGDDRFKVGIRPVITIYKK